MPIIIKDFLWHQTESVVSILVPLRGVHPSKVDVFTSERYLKLSYQPFFFEVLLFETIDKTKSKCTFTSEHAIFELIKYKPKHWDTLECILPKVEKNNLKQKCIEEEFKNFQKELDNKSNKRHELKRVAVREQISLETKQRECVQKLKNDEKSNALGNLNQWQKQLEYKKQNDNDDDNVKKIETESDFNAQTESESEDDMQELSSHNSYPTFKIPEPLQPVRTSKTLTVTFTKRELPTPCRESKLAEENDWLRKQAEARRSVGFDSEDLRPEEKSPQYLKCKGDEFFKQENYLGAISAYTFGIKLSSKYVDLYIGRSAAHFAIGNMYKSAEDCSKALELMKPEVLANLEQRVVCIFRRGVSLFKIGFKEKGINEVRAALKLQPNNKEIKAELSKMMDEFADQDSD